MSYIVSSGEVSSGVSLYYDSMFVLNGGTATATTVDSDGKLYVSSGGAAVGTVANSMGKIYVSSGGSIVSTTLVEGEGAEKCLVYAGAVASDTVVDGGADLDVYGTAYHTIVQGGSYPDKSDLFLRDGGVAFDTTISSGAWLSVEDKCYASGVQVSSGGSLVVSSGGTATDAIVDPYAYIYVSSGGTALQIKENGGYVKVADGAEVSFVANVLSGLVLSYGKATVHSGTTATSMTVNTSGYLYIFNGGTATGTVANSMGKIYVSSGGMATATTVNGWGNLHVSSGGTAAETTVNGWGNLHISSGGTATNTTVNSGGSLYVSSCGTVTDAIVDPYAYIYVSSGGTALQIKENGGYVEVADGAEVSFIANVLSGLDLTWAATLHSGTTATEMTVNCGGKLCVYDGGTALQVMEKGGYVEVADGAEVSFVANAFSGLILSSGQSATVHSGTTATATTVNSGGSLYVSSGGMATETTVTGDSMRGGLMYVCSGGTATATTIYTGYLCVSSGGTATGITATQYSYLHLTVAPNTYIQGTDDGSAFEMKNGFLSGYAVNYRKSLDVLSGGTALETAVNYSGYMYVSSGGTATATTVNSGGSVLVSNGGTAMGTIVQGDTRIWYTYGHLFVSSGGTATATTVKSGGCLNVSSGGTATATTVSGSGAVLCISSGGTATETTVNSGGNLYVSSGGTATETAINAGGNLHVSSGGTATETNVNSGGWLDVSSGGTATETIINSYGGMIVFSDGTATIAFNPWQGSVLSGEGALVEYLARNAGIYYGSNGCFVGKADHSDSKTINSGESMIVYDGGTATKTTVNFDGDLCVFSGGSALQIKENGGYVEVADGAEVSFVANAFSGLILNAGQSTTIHSATTATEMTVNFGGKLSVYDGGMALQVRENSGYVEVADGAEVSFVANAFSGLVLSSGQSATVHSGTTAASTTINNNGSLYIFDGGTATATTVNSCGNLHVSSGGTALQIKENGGYVWVTDGAEVSFAANAFSGLLLSSGQSATIHSGTTATATTVNWSGNLHVSNGGTATNTTIDYYGCMHVSSGGTAASTTVNYMCNLYVSSGGTATATTVNGMGKMFVASGGTVTGIVANNGRLHLTVVPDTYIQGAYNGSAFEMKNGFLSGYAINVGGGLSS